MEIQRHFSPEGKARIRVVQCMLLVLLLSVGCSKRSKIRSTLEQSEALLSQGDTALRKGDVERAKQLYGKSTVLAESLEAFFPEEPGLADRIFRIKNLATHRAQSVEAPEGCILSLFEAIRTGDHEGFRLMSDLQALAERNNEEPWWTELTAADRERLLSCIEATTQQWMSERLDAFRALQQSLHTVEREGDEAVAKATLRSPAGEVGILYYAHKTNGRWQITDFRIPDLDVSLEDYTKNTLWIASKSFGSVVGLLRDPNAAQLCCEAFEAAEKQILDVDESLVGRTVALKNGPPKICTVIKQSVKRDGEWLLVSESEEDLSSAQWVSSEDVELIDLDAETWGLQ